MCLPWLRNASSCTVHAACGSKMHRSPTPPSTIWPKPTEDQFHIARVISDVWLSNLLAWLTRRASANDVSKRLDLAVRLLIGDEDVP